MSCRRFHQIPKLNLPIASDEDDEASDWSSSDSGDYVMPRGERPSTTHRVAIMGLLMAAAALAVLLRSRWHTEDEGHLGSNYFLDGGEPSQLEAATAEWDESKSVLAHEASGLAGMSPTEDVVYTGTIGDWKGAKSKITSIHDVTTPGMKCRKHEELFFGICYKNCSLLTNGMYTIRFAPNGCCRALPCLLPSEVDLDGFAPGYGYFVSGGGKGHFPHAPGECMGNEESHLGFCYKKCSLLTNNEFNYRMGTNTCCKKKHCWSPFNWNIFNVKTEGTWCSGFAVGGALSKRYECPHRPEIAGGPHLSS